MSEPCIQTIAPDNGFPKRESVHGNSDNNHATFPVPESEITETLHTPSKSDNILEPGDNNLDNKITFPPTESGDTIAMASKGKNDGGQSSTTNAVINLDDNYDSVETFQPAGKKSTKKLIL